MDRKVDVVLRLESFRYPYEVRQSVRSVGWKSMLEILNHNTYFECTHGFHEGETIG